MPGYRTIPAKDTFDVDEKLGGIITIKQLGYIIISCVLTYFAFVFSTELFGDTSDTIYVWGTVLFASLLFSFSNADKWFVRRLKYYFVSNKSRVEHEPNILRNILAGEEDKLVTLDGRVIAVLKVMPINFPLLSDEAKEGKIGAYETYLRQLVYPVMHLVISDDVDVHAYSMNMERNSELMKGMGVKNMVEYCQSHIHYLQTFIKKNKARAKNHYVVIQVEDPRYRGAGKEGGPGTLDMLMRHLRALLTEFRPEGLLEGGKSMAKPRNYVHIDAIGKRMIYADEFFMPGTLPPRSSRVGLILQFESVVAMLRYARSQQGKLYYGTVDLDTIMKKEFHDMPLSQREKEFTVEERRRHVGLSGGKTRWAYDEVEKHVSVLADKLDGAGLHVKRLRGEELYSGPHMNMSSASKIRVEPKYLQVDNTYMQVVYATGYPYLVNLGWLSNIVDGREDYDLAMYIYPVPIQDALSIFRSARLKLSTEKKARGDFLDPETEQHLDDVTNFYSQIVSGKEKYFQSSLYITAKAPTLKSLDTVLEKCKSDLAGSSIDYQTAEYDMARAVYSTRLTGRDLLSKKREFPSSSLAATFPHISSSIEIDNEGIFFAFDWMNTPVIMDLRLLPNQHISVLGESGSGKSYFAKSIIPRYLMAGYQVFVTDPDGEYAEMAKYFGGTVSSVGPSNDICINPFDLEQGRDANDKVRSLLGMFSIICGQLTKYQEGIISETLIELYAKKPKNKQVTMSSFSHELAKALKKTKDGQLRHDIEFLQIAIKPFIKGNLYGFIDRPTSVRIDGRLHVFNLREYKNDKTLKDFFNYLIFDFISHRLMANKGLKALFMDEGWTMVNYPGSEDYVRYIIKDSRKYNASFVFITQELEDMLSSQAGRSILNNTSTQFIFHQKESAMALMKKTLNLTDTEYEKLIACAKGEGLLISDKNRLFFRVQSSKEEHDIISLSPAEKKKEKKKVEKEEGAPKMEEALSPSLKAALGMSPYVASSMGMGRKSAEQAGQEEKKAILQEGARAAGAQKSPEAMREEKRIILQEEGKAQGIGAGKIEGADLPASKKEPLALSEPKLVLPDEMPKRVNLPIAITHNLISEKEMLRMLKPIGKSEFEKNKAGAKKNKRKKAPARKKGGKKK